MKKYLFITIQCLLFTSILHAQSGWMLQESGTKANLHGLCVVEHYAQMKIITVGENGTFLLSDDEGVTWTSYQVPTNKTLRSISFSSPDSGIMVGDSGIIFKVRLEQLGGCKFELVPNPGFTNDLNDIYLAPIPRKTGWAVGDSCTILWTTNRGSSWQSYIQGPKPVNFNLNSYSLEPDRWPRMMAVGDSGTILRANRLYEWNKIEPPQELLGRNFYGVSFINDTGWFVGEGGAIAHTKSGGQYWVTQKSGVTVTLHGGFFPDGYYFLRGVGWVVGDSGVILKTTNDGWKWNRQESGTHTNLRKVLFLTPEIGIIIGENGTILRTTVGGDVKAMFSPHPSTLEFGTVVKSATKVGSLTIQNDGILPLDIQSVISDNDKFSISPNNVIIPPLSHFTFTVTFSPINQGTDTVRFIFTDNAEGSPHIVKGVGSCVEPSTVNWSWQNPHPMGNFIYDVAYIGNNTFVGVGECGTFLKSTNGGIDWMVKDKIDGISGRIKAITSVTNDHCIAVGDQGTIIRSEDGGDNWHLQQSGTNNYLNAVSFIDPSNGYIVGGGDFFPPGFGSIHHTSDGGTIWQIKYFNPQVRFYGISAITPTKAVAVGFNLAGQIRSVIYRTSDGGVNWIKQFEGLSGFLTKVQFISENVGIAVGSEGIIYRSSDGGISWYTVESGTLQTLNDISFSDSQNGMIVGNGGVVLKTSNAGLSWSAINIQTQNYLKTIALSNSGDGVAIGWNLKPWKPALYHVSSGGLIWQDRASTVTGQKLRSISFSDLNNGLVVGDRGTLLHTTNGGKTWTRRLQGTLFESAGVLFSSVHFIDNFVGTVVGGGGVILRTMDGGLNWTVQTSGVTHSLNDMLFFNTYEGFVVGSNGTILRTTNGGNDWFNNSGYTNKSLNSISFSDSYNGVAVGDDGIILHTTNKGIDWLPRNSGTNLRLKSVSLRSNIGVAIGEQGIILRTSDAGNSWSKQTSVITNTLNEVYFFDDNTGIAVGLNGAIIRTTDGGLTWVILPSVTNNSLYGVSILDGNIGTVVGDYGTILRTTTGLVRVDELLLSEIPIEFRLHQNYPNPFNPSTTIRYELPRESFVTLKVYNLLGQEVATLVNEKKEAGRYNIEFRISDFGFSSGVYFYRLVAEDYVSTKKFLLLK
ncbi:MAG: YCF48-related protein [Bacteroidota bacterium]|nr:YCF48-related protein [Bacteroidota bacterium]